MISIESSFTLHVPVPAVFVKKVSVAAVSAVPASMYTEKINVGDEGKLLRDCMNTKL